MPAKFSHYTVSSLYPDVAHVINYPRPPQFFYTVSDEKLGGAWEQGDSMLIYRYLSLEFWLLMFVYIADKQC